MPTDVVPWVVSATPLTLRDGEGNVVPSDERYVTPRSALCDTHRELVPKKPLVANSEYTIVAEPSLDARDMGAPFEVTFTTGDGPLDSPLPKAPSLELVFFDASEFLSSCVYDDVQGCLFTEDSGLLQVSLVGDEEHPQVGTASDLTNLLLGWGDEQRCLQISARDVAGRLSEPVGQCVDPTTLSTLAADGSPLVPSCDSAEVQALRDTNDPNLGDGGQAGEANTADAGGDAEPSRGAPDASDPDKTGGSSHGGCSLSVTRTPRRALWAPFALVFLSSVGYRARRRARR